MNKITIIGDSGSGKTCYLYAMYHQLSYGYIKGFTVSCMTDDYIPHPDYEKDEELGDCYKKLENPNLGAERFPYRSDVKENYVFSLKYRLQDVLLFKWIDYPGGYIDSRNGGSEEFLADLRLSDSWVIFIDGLKLYKALVEIKDPAEKNRFLHEQVFGKYERCLHNNASLIPSFISIIVTKSDLLLKPLFKKWYEELTNYSPSERIKYAQSKAREEVSDLFKENIFDNIPEEKFQISISYVTLGDSISENNYAGQLEPRNIEFPITISILSILEKQYKAIVEEIKRKESEIERIRQSIFTSKEKRIALQKEIDNTLRPKLEHKKTVAIAILERVNEDVILYNHGRDNQISIKNYFNNAFNIN